MKFKPCHEPFEPPPSQAPTVHRLDSHSAHPATSCPRVLAHSAPSPLLQYVKNHTCFRIQPKYHLLRIHQFYFMFLWFGFALRFQHSLQSVLHFYTSILTASFFFLAKYLASNIDVCFWRISANFKHSLYGKWLCVFLFCKFSVGIPTVAQWDPPVSEALGCKFNPQPSAVG